MLVLQLDPEHCVRQRLDDRSLYRYAFLFGHTAFLFQPGRGLRGPKVTVSLSGDRSR
jgi:hypothetical protein